MHYVTGEDCPPGSPLIQAGSICLWSLGDIVYILGLCPKGFKPSNSLSKGAIRAYGLSIAAMAALPANSGPASDDALFGTRGRDPRSGRAWFSRGLLAAARAL